MMDKGPTYYKYWGKAEKDGSRYHLLPYHCLDVAAVAAAWWDQSTAIRHELKVGGVKYGPQNDDF
jgi:CRISPR-associated endonuclease/helicase Cas3